MDTVSQTRCATCCRVIGKSCSFFDINGVGALRVKTSDGNGKVYDCLFTCSVTRHLKIVSVETFIQALRRFAARRPLPRIMLSDNASTYEAVAVELTRLINSDKVGEALCTLEIH